MKFSLVLALFVSALLLNAGESSAQTAAVPQRVRICSQNLHNYGAPERKPKATSKRSRRRQVSNEEFLLQRFVAANCDVIAVQEVTGSTTKDSLRILQRLARLTSERTARPFQAVVAEKGDGRIRSGFLLASDRSKLLSTQSFYDVDLPRLQRLGPSRIFTRSPLLVRLQIANNKLLVMNMHLKSKVDAWRDPTETAFEAQRMESTAALRQLLLKELSSEKPGTAAVILGDRNTDSGSAASEVLAGTRELSDFQGLQLCRVDNELRASCPDNLPKRKPVFLDLMEVFNRQRAAAEQVRSYRYRGELSALDAIFLSAEALPLAGQPLPRLGMEGVFGKGSDHKLVWLDLQLPK